MKSFDEKIKILSSIPSAWGGHFEFSQWLVNHKKPTTIVDLGVDYGYSTFCFAIPKHGKVYGIDNFNGEEHTGIRDTEFYVRNKIKELELENISIIKGDFSEIAEVWGKPIDILHIDGLHTYDGVKNDYDTWFKFLANDGVVLFHDTCIKDRGFGVHKFFDELNLPKINFLHSAGLGVASKDFQLIEKIQKEFNHLLESKHKIGIFYHLYQHGPWEEIYNDQMNELKQSGLYDAAEFIDLGINGDLPIPHDPKVRQFRNTRKDLESDTLRNLWSFAKQKPDYKIMYMHAKGVTWQNTIQKDAVNKWRKYLEHYTITRWKDCYELLKVYDCVGTEWEENIQCDDYRGKSPHYSGNFWWSNASYINKLDPNYLYSDLYKGWTRWQGEFWIGTKDPKYFNFMTLGMKTYGAPVNPKEYENNKNYFRL